MPGVCDKPVLLYLVTEDWYFCSHRLQIARAARDAGWQVIVATRVRNHGDAILREGFRLTPIRLRRHSLAPWRELMAIAELIRIYRRERPSLVHHVAMKPVFYGSIAAALVRVPAVINALAGMGYIFASSSLKARLLRRPIRTALGWLLDRPNSRVIVQNPDDVALLTKTGMVAAERVVLVRGSGVDTAAFSYSDEPDGTPVAVMVSRMLWDKGVGELVEAARLLRQWEVPLHVVLVGPPDPDNPASIPETQLQRWNESGAIAWWGERTDIAEIWAKSHIAVLPSYYGEGLPKSLLEAAACGRAMVAANTPGCREVVRDGETGILVPPRDAASLAKALKKLAYDSRLRRRLGRAARALVEGDLSQEAVAVQTLALYHSLVPGRAR